MKTQTSTIKTLLTGAALVALFASPLARADYSSTVVSQGPVGYWRLNETTPVAPPVTTAANGGSLAATGNGTYQGSQGFFRGFAGALASSDTAVQFDGSSQDVLVGYDAALSPGSFSIEAWLNAAADTANCALSCGTFSNPRSGWLIYQNSTGGYNLRMYNQAGTATSVNISSTGDTVIGAWSHVVATYDGTTAKLYVNGVLKASAAGAYVPGVAGSPFSIGMRTDAGFRWAGKADEVAYYNTVLSANDIAAHHSAATTNAAGYAAQIGASSPVLYFRLNEAGNTGTPNLGTLGAAGNGEYTSGSTPGQNGPRPTDSPAFPGFETLNYAVGLDGVAGTVAVPALHLNANTVTISGWVKPNGSQPLGAGLVVCNDGVTDSGLTMDQVYGGLDVGYIWAGNKYAGWRAADNGFPALVDGQWTYLALVIQPLEADLYLGDQAGNWAHVTNTFNVTHGLQAFAGATLLGSSGGATPAFFKGAMDEVSVFNKASGEGDVFTQYATAVGGMKPTIFVDLHGPASVYQGDPFVLALDAGGTAPITYTWKTNGVAAAVTTVPTLSIDSAVAGHAGPWEVAITNGAGFKISSQLNITIIPVSPPAITDLIGFTNRTLYPGGTLSLAVVATGGSLKYQWNKGGSPIASATSSAYRVERVTTGDAGSYTVTVTNGAPGTITSGSVTFTIPTPASGFEAAIVADKPEAWYRLDETSGMTMWDAMGRHDGVYTNINGGDGTVTYSAAGAIAGSSDTAVTFSAANTSVGFVPFSPKLNGQTFTIECWAKTTDTATSRCAVSSRASDPAGYWLYTYPIGSWSGGVSSGGNNYYVPSATAADGLVSGEWKHVVMLYDTSLKIYVNGQWDGTGYVDFVRNTSAPFIIGGRGGVAPLAEASTLWEGQVDEVLVYTNGLTLAQVQNHYSLAKYPTPIKPYWLIQPASTEVVSNSAATVTLTAAADGPIPIAYQWFKNGSLLAGATTTVLSLACDYTNAAAYYLRATNSTGATNSLTANVAMISATPAYVNVTNGLVLHLKFDGNLADSSGRGNNGTAVLTGTEQAPNFVSPGRLGSSALFFYTSNSIPSVSYVTLGKPTDLNFGTSTDLSVSYWAKYAAGQTNGDLPFLCSAVNSYGNPGFTFAPSYNQGGWSYSLNGVCQVYGGANTINDGNWHHVITTVNRGGSATTWLDGIQVDSRLATAIGNLDTGNTVNIGQDPTGTYTEDGSAALDDLAVWRRCLSPAEVYSIHYAATNSNSSFDVPGTNGVPALSIAHSGSNVTVTWNPGATLGALYQTTSLTPPVVWTKVNVFSPSYTFTPSGAATYFKLGLIE